MFNEALDLNQLRSRVLEGDQEAARELLEMARAPAAELRSALAASALCKTEWLTVDVLPSLNCFGLYAALAHYEQTRYSGAEEVAERILWDRGHCWQVRCKAIFYLHSLGRNVLEFQTAIRNLREEAAAGLNLQEGGVAPDPSFKSSLMVELQLQVLEHLIHKAQVCT